MHNEFHKFKPHFEKKRSIAGYIKNNCVEPRAMSIMHDIVAMEMEIRDYKHNSPYILPDLSYLPLEHLYYRIDKDKSLDLLLNRCPECYKRYLQFLCITNQLFITNQEVKL